MPRVVFTSNLQRHISAPPRESAGKTVREALDEVFAHNPPLRGYILDDQNRVRQHVVIFVSGQRIKDTVTLSDTVSETDEIYVMQALSGG
ncbi:MAG: MoaD/ThiS family protein [Chloroflexota bacterium]